MGCCYVRRHSMPSRAEHPAILQYIIKNKAEAIDAMPNTDFIFGLAGNAVINRLAEPAKQRACGLWA